MRSRSLAVLAILLFSVLAGIGFALTPPPPPPPPVPQNLGIYDTSIDNLKTNATDQSACRACHQSSGTNVSNGYNNTLGGVDTRHHNLLTEPVLNPFTNAPFGCQDCHPTVTGGNGVLLDHSCTDCHNGTNFWGDSAFGAHVGNFSRPHHVNTTYDDAHIGNPAANRTCNFCHGSFVDNYNDGHYVPTYNTSLMITPLATFKITNFSQPDGLGTGGFKEWGGCESCHVDNPNAVPFPIGENHHNHHKEILGFGLDPTGESFGGTTPFQNASTPFNLSIKCQACHVIDTFKVSSLDTTDTTGTILEYDQNVTNPTAPGGIESISPVVEVRNSTIEQSDIAKGFIDASSANGIVTMNGTGCEKCHDVKSIHNIQFNYVQNGPQGLGHINNNTDCYGCHNSWLPQDTWTPGPLVPTVSTVSPLIIPVGTPTTLTMTGLNFINPDGNYTSVVTVDGTAYTPSSEISTQLSVDIPALSAGIHQLQLVKAGNTLGQLITLTVVKNPTVSSVIYTPARNGPGTITVNGAGFGNKPATNAQYYVSVNHAGTQVIAQSISKWTDNQIIGKISNVGSGDTTTVLTTTAGEAQANIK